MMMILASASEMTIVIKNLPRKLDSQNLHPIS